MSNAVTESQFELANGQKTSLNNFKGNVVLVVNVASECGLTPQYEGLEKIYKKYHGKNFEIIGFPANEFGAQEPGSNEQIQSFCQMNYGVTFPVAKKIVVKGNGIHPLYQGLITAQPKAIPNKAGTLVDVLKKHNLLSGTEQEIMWNFEKFLINKKGEVVARFAPDLTPESDEVLSAIESELKK